MNLNSRYLQTSDRLAALRKARRTLRSRDRRLSRMKKRLESFMSTSGVEVGDEVQAEMESVIERHSAEIGALPGSHFQRFFWDQQV